MAFNTYTQQLYITEYSSHQLRMIYTQNGTCTTICGSTSGTADGACGVSAFFMNPKSIVFDHISNYLYMADSNGARISRLDMNQRKLFFIILNELLLFQIQLIY